MAGLVLVLAGGALVLGNPWRERAAVGPLESTPSVLALPAKVIGNSDAAYLGDAVPDTLSTLLAGVEGLDTKVPPSSGQVDRVQGDMARIAEAYRADFLILTSVTVDHDRLRLNVRLAEASTQKIRWASQYEANRSNYNGLIRDAAQALARILKPGGVGLPHLQPKDGSDVTLALQEGRYYLGKYGTHGQLQDYASGRRAFDRALQLSPSSPRVFAAVGYSFWEKWNRDGDAQAVKEAETWARRAVDQDPRCDAWAILALIETCKPRVDPDKAIGWAVKAVRYAPREPGVHGALGAVMPGPLFMVACGRQEQEMDPIGDGEPGMTASGLVWLGRSMEALPILDKALAMNPEHPFRQAAKAFALVRLGRLPEAEALLNRCRPTPSPRVSFAEDYWNQVHFGLVAAQGKPEGSRTLGRRLVNRYLDPRTDAANLINGAITMSPDLMRLGLEEEVLTLFERCVEIGYAPGLDWLASAPELRALENNPRYARVLRASMEGAAIAVKHLEQAKTAGELPRYLEQPLAELKALMARPVVRP